MYSTNSQASMMCHVGSSMAINIPSGGGVGNRGSCPCVGTWSMWKISVSSLNFAVNLTLYLKNYSKKKLLREGLKKPVI